MVRFFGGSPTVGLFERIKSQPSFAEGQPSFSAGRWVIAGL